MQTQVTSIGTFIGGLNTEQPQLADQVQYTADELNCQLLPDGTRARRYGLTREESSVGVPMAYSTKDWKTTSVEYTKEISENDTTYADTFSFDVHLETIGTAGDPVTIIKDGDSTDRYIYFSSATSGSTVEYRMCMYVDGETNPILDPLMFTSNTQNPHTDYRIKFFIWPQDTTQIMCAVYYLEDGEETFSFYADTATASLFEFDNFVNVLQGPFTTTGGTEFTIDNVRFLKDGETVLTPSDASGADSYLVQYNKPGEYTLNITEAGMYTIWMAAGGAEEGHQIVYDLQGSGGGSLKAYVALEEGSYTIKVGHKGGTVHVEEEAQQQYLNRVFKPYTDPITSNYLWIGQYITLNGISGLANRPILTITPGTETSFYKGGKSQAFSGLTNGTYDKYGWTFQGSYTESWYPNEVFNALRGTINLTKVPEQFSIKARTTDEEVHSTKSLFTDDVNGPGAINKDGCFKIMKGQIADDWGQEGSDVVVINGKETNAYYWSNFDKKGTDCVVLQQGSFLRFYKAKRPYGSQLIAELDTTSQITSSSFSKYSFSSGEGFLLAVSEFVEPFYVTLSEDPAGAVLTPINIQIRDLTGVDDSLTVDEQPTSLSDKHKYNLLNQGWDETKINSYNTSQHKYPSNALIWWLGRNSSGDFDVPTLTKVYFGSTPAPKGHYILDYFNQDRTTASSVQGLDTIKKDRYVCDVAFFAGRFFYLTSSTVLFSQVIREDIRNIGKCFQDADPTSQHISDIVATDGGEIIFQELGYGKAIKKFPLGLIVFGDKSVYSIQSTAGNTFTATQYQTQFVTHAGAISGKSVVNAEDVIFYWSPQGIYQISVDQVSGTQAIASSASANTIQQWYNNLPNFSKENCIGAYDYANRRIVWLYPTDEDNLEIHDGVLAYYLDFQAFVPSKVSIDGGKLFTVFETTIPSFIVPSIGLYAGNDDITAGDNDVIVKDFGGEFGRNFSVCYLGYIKSYDRLFFCDFASREFIDFGTGLYKSYALSYPITFGSTFNKKYTPVAQCYFLRTEEDEMNNGTYLAPSSCYIRARWKWGETSDSHKWDLVQEGYIRIPRFMNFRYVNGKIRIKGSGPSMQLMLESKEDNDFKLSGINLEIRTV